MYKAYKYRIYPTKAQEQLLAQHFGATRWIYNYALNKKTVAYQKDKTNLSRFDIQKRYSYIKKKMTIRVG